MPHDKRRQVIEQGFCTTEGVYSSEEITGIIDIIEGATPSGANYRKSEGLFAIRGLLQELPELCSRLWTIGLRRLIEELGGEGYFCTKAIFLDKLAQSNWVVAWHQDVMISVEGRAEVEGFGPWASKNGWTTVQPTADVLENTLTLRIHLDDCDQTNGALRIVPGSHRSGILAASTIQDETKRSVTCPVKKGGVFAMRPLLLHASNKSTSYTRRRVIHLEFSSVELPAGLKWREKQDFTFPDSRFNEV